MQVPTTIRPESVMLTLENGGDLLTALLVLILTEPFRRGTEGLRSDHAGVGLGLAIVRGITHARRNLTLTPRAAGGLRATVHSPQRRALVGT